jgi:hypothetical protein
MGSLRINYRYRTYFDKTNGHKDIHAEDPCTVDLHAQDARDGVRGITKRPARRPPKGTQDNTGERGKTIERGVVTEESVTITRPSGIHKKYQKEGGTAMETAA